MIKILKQRLGTTTIGKGFYTFGANLILLVVSFLTSILISRVLGPEGKGKYDLIIATTSLLGVFFGLSLNSGIVYVVAQLRSNIKRLGVILVGFSALQGFAVYSLLLFIKQFDIIEILLPSQTGLSIIMLVSIGLVLMSVNGFAYSILIGKQKILEANNISLINKFLFLFLLGFAVLFLKRDYQIFVILLCISYGISIIFYLFSIPWGVGEGSSGIKAIFIFSLPCYFGNLVQFLNYRLDVFFVNFYSDSKSLGLYTLAVSLGQMVWLFSNAFATVIFPKIASKDQTDEENAVRVSQITRLSLIASAIVAIFGAVLAPFFIPLIYGNDYSESVLPLLLLLPGIILFSIVNILASYAVGIGRPKINLYIAIVGLIITVVLDLVLIPHYSINGAAVASSVSYLASTVLTVSFFHRVTRTPIKNIFLPKPEDILLIRRFLLDLFERKSLEKE